MNARIEKIRAALPAAAKDPAVTNKQAWDEYIDPGATTPFESITEAERIVYIAALTVNECLLDGDMDELTTKGQRSMRKFNFSSCGLDYGMFEGETQEQAQDAYARNSNYRSWADMVEQAEEFGGNNVEVKEVFTDN